MTDEDGQLEPVVKRGPPLVPRRTIRSDKGFPTRLFGRTGYNCGMITGIHHTGLATRDLDRLQEFYCRHFHGNVLTEFAWSTRDTELSQRLGFAQSAGRLCMLGFAATRLEIFEFAIPVIERTTLRSVAAPGFSHIAFEVDDIDAEFDRLSAVMSFNAPPLKMSGGGIFAYGRDPDGNVIELLQPPA